MPETTDFLIIGAGIIGLRCAIAARRRFPEARVIVIDKEDALGRHASGRNSGVLHAGFYYGADSFKARFTREGNARLTAYCIEHGLAINRCGKLVVARGPDELPVLEELLARGERNDVEVRMVSEGEAREIEPRVRTHDRALHSPSTATVDPVQVVAAFARETTELGVELRTSTGYTGRGGADAVLTSRGTIAAGFVINAAGLYADRIARDFGFGERYRVLPFKGLYLDGRPQAPPLRTCIYPVPDLAVPFLGVHLTVGARGRTHIGPTALPALWREHYRGLANFAPGELLEVLRLEGRMFLTNENAFRDLALRELPKLRRRELVERAAALARDVREEDFPEWGRPGIRAQLVDVKEWRLVDDFVLEGDERSLHVLNAVSPAFTCAIPFAEFVLEEIADRPWGGGDPGC